MRRGEIWVGNLRPAKEPLHVTIQPRDRVRSVCQVMPEQPRTLDRRRLVEGPLTRLSTGALRGPDTAF